MLMKHPLAIAVMTAATLTAQAVPGPPQGRGRGGAPPIRPEPLAMADHAGFESKEKTKSELLGLDLEVVDKGTNSLASVDYPDFAAAVGRAVVSGEVECGILICGSGIGVSIAANKIPGARAALCWNEESTRLAREHNDANILCFGGRFIEPDQAARMVRLFLETKFAGGRHAQRVEKLAALDRN